MEPEARPWAEGAAQAAATVAGEPLPAPPRVAWRTPRLLAAGLGRRALWLALGVLLWYAVVAIVHAAFSRVVANAFPYPGEILRGYSTYLGTFASATGETVLWALAGFGIGCSVGFVAGMVMSQIRLAERAFMPYLVILQMVPLFAFIPVVFSATASLNFTRLTVAALLTVFVVTVGVLQGAKSADDELGEVFVVYNASRWSALRKGIIPKMSPYLFSVARNAAPISITGALVVDIIGGTSGLGFLMISGLTLGHSQTLLLWGAMLITIALAGALALVVRGIERVVAPWEAAE